MEDDSNAMKAMKQVRLNLSDSAEKRPASRPGAKRLECEQLAAALDRHWVSYGHGALDHLATCDSGSKLRALQTLRAAPLRYLLTDGFNRTQCNRTFDSPAVSS